MRQGGRKGCRQAGRCSGSLCYSRLCSGRGSGGGVLRCWRRLVFNGGFVCGHSHLAGFGSGAPPGRGQQGFFQRQRLAQHVALGILAFDAPDEFQRAFVVFEPCGAKLGSVKQCVIGKAAVCMAHGNGFITFDGLAGISFGKGAAGKFFKAFCSAEEGGGPIGPAGVSIID